jgi:hypothetical protein
MVYAAAYCPMSFKSTLEEMGFDGAYPFPQSLFTSVERLMNRLKGTKSRRPSEIMGFFHLEYTIMLLLSYTLAPGYISRDVKACTCQSESTS